MTSPYADLRARLAPLAAAFNETLSTEERVMIARHLVNAYPEIDALLARGEAAEAELKGLRAYLRECPS